jgi:hypothetical protein
MEPTVNCGEERQAMFHIHMVRFGYFYCNAVGYGYTCLNASALIAYYAQGKGRRPYSGKFCKEVEF